MSHRTGQPSYLKHGDRFGVQPPVMTFPHAVLVSEVNHPALLDGDGPHPLGLLDALDQALDRDVALGGLGRHVRLEVVRSDYRSAVVLRCVRGAALLVTLLACPLIVTIGALATDSVQASSWHFARAIIRNSLRAFLVRVVAAIFTLDSLLDDSHQELVTEVTLGGLGVGVQNKCVRDLQTGCHLHLHPGWATWKYKQKN